MCYNTVITRKLTGISNTRPLPNVPSMKNWVKLNEPLHYKIHKDQTSSYVSSFVRHSDQCVFSFYSIDLLQFGECQSAQTRSNPHCREIDLPSDSFLWLNTVLTLIPCHRVHFRAAKRGLLLFSGRQTDAHASARSDFDYGGDFVTGGREGEAEAERETTQSGEESVRVEWGQATFLSAVKHGGCAGTLGLSHCGVTYKYGFGLKASLVRAGSTIASCGFTEKLVWNLVKICLSSFYWKTKAHKVPIPSYKQRSAQC